MNRSILSRLRKLEEAEAPEAPVSFVLKNKKKAKRLEKKGHTVVFMTIHKNKELDAITKAEMKAQGL